VTLGIEPEASQGLGDVEVELGVTVETGFCEQGGEVSQRDVGEGDLVSERLVSVIVDVVVVTGIDDEHGVDGRSCCC